MNGQRTVRERTVFSIQKKDYEINENNGTDETFYCFSYFSLFSFIS